LIEEQTVLTTIALDPAQPTPDTESDFSPRKLKVMVGCLLGTLLGTHFLTISAVSIVMLPMTKEFGWSRAGISGAVTLLLLLGAFMTAIWGRLIDKIGVKVIVICGTLGVGLATLSLSLGTKSLPQFYLGFAALGFFGSTAVGYSKIIGALFTKNRGKALAVFGMESTLVGALSPLIIYTLVAHFGWRGMFVGLGLIVICVALSLIFLLDEAGLNAVRGAPRPPPTAVFDGMTIKAVLKSPAFWLINLATMAGNMTATGLLPHLAALVISRGMTVQTGVAALTVHTVALPAGQFVGGFLLDKTNTARIAAPFAAIAFVGLVLMALATTTVGGPLLLLAGAGLLGFGNGAKRSMTTYFFTRFFGLKALAEVSGWSLAATSVVLAPAPLLFGAIYDRTHSYNGMLWILGIGIGLATFLYLGLGPYRYARDIQAKAPSA
jgi:MFS family permease